MPRKKKVAARHDAPAAVPSPRHDAPAAVPSPRPTPVKKPLTERHKAYLRALDECPVTVVTGPAGTAKTALAVQAAVRQLRAGRVGRIVLTRPAVECDEDLGFRPGDQDAKMAPLVAALTAFLEDELGGELPKLQAAGMIEIVPLAVMRGRTFHDTFVIADEMQGATYKQLKMFFTRTGEGSRVAVTGDVGQSDLKLRKGEEVPLARAVRQVQAHPKNPAAVLEFTRADVLRSGLAQFFDEALAG